MNGAPVPRDAAHSRDEDSTGVGRARGACDIYGFVPRRAVDCQDVGLPALRLFIVMSSYADGSTRRCYAAQTLAQDLGWASGGYWDTRRVRRYLPALIEADLIREDGRHVWADGRWTDQYLIAPFTETDSDVVSPSVDSEGDVVSTSVDISPTESDVVSPFAELFGGGRKVTPRPAESDTTSGPKVTPRHSNQTPSSDPSNKPIFANDRSREEMEQFYNQQLAEEEERRGEADAS